MVERNHMGQTISQMSGQGWIQSTTPSRSITISHKFASSPPAGFSRNGTLHFNVNPTDTIGELLDKLNEYRSPSNAIKSLLDQNGNPYPSTMELRVSTRFFV